MGIKTKREAVVAAHFVRRSKITNPKAIERLGQFAASLNLFEHNNTEDDWDNYTNRVQTERDQDTLCDITERSVAKGVTPKEVFQADQDAFLAKKIDEAQPSLTMAPAPIPVAFTDPNSVDYRDPNDFYRTNLIKAAIDNDPEQIKKLVSDGHANLYVTDVEGNNALQNAINFGNDEMAFLLRRLMAERPQTIRHSKSA